MISMQDYIGPWAKSPDWTPARQANAARLLTAVNSLIMVAMQERIALPVNPKTKSQVSGEQYGGFRPQSCPEGAPDSAHKEGLAVDIYDPSGAIDAWLQKSPAAQRKYEELGLYFEHPTKTPGWSHWGLRRPPSGKRFFYP